jgi:hypothetical protein
MNYLFLAIPNFCGSTLVHNLLTTSKNVVPLTAPKLVDDSTKFIDFVEGNICAPRGYRNLHGPHSMEANMEHVYANPDNYDWDYIKSEWTKNWESTNSSASIRLQKTPADIFRIKQMLPYFPNTKWILSIRNPYTYVESIYRKSTFQMEPEKQLDQICHHVLRTMELQILNAEMLGNDAYAMRYEDFCTDPLYHVQKWQKMLPELGEIDLSKYLWVKGNYSNIIEDDSVERLERFINRVPNIIEKINVFLEPHKNIVEAWGYKLL